MVKCWGWLMAVAATTSIAVDATSLYKVVSPPRYHHEATLLSLNFTAIATSTPTLTPTATPTPMPSIPSSDIADDFLRMVFNEYYSRCRFDDNPVNPGGSLCCDNSTILYWMKFSGMLPLSPCLKNATLFNLDPRVCLKGYFRDPTKENAIDHGLDGCPKGYFCPTGAYCLIRCSQGGMCGDAPVAQNVTDNPVGECLADSPYKYCCNGVPSDIPVCPGNSDETPCQGGSYCPNGTNSEVCPAGYFCREGEVQPKRCALFSSCPAGTTTNVINFTGAMIVVGISLLLLLGVKTLDWREATAEHVATLKKRAGDVGVEAARKMHARRKSFDEMVLLNDVAELNFKKNSGNNSNNNNTNNNSNSNNNSNNNNSSYSNSNSYSNNATLLSSMSSSPSSSSILLDQPPQAQVQNDHQHQQHHQQQYQQQHQQQPYQQQQQQQQSEASTTLTSPGSKKKRHSRSISIPAKLIDLSSSVEMRHPLETAANRNQRVKTRTPISIKFNNLRLTLKNDKSKVLLNNVSGVIEPGKITAVMGPSGAGKTTLLNVVLNKAYYGDISGEVLINGTRMPLSALKQDIGFVPQDDVMHPCLKVKEVLMYQARLRLPSDYSRKKIDALVSEVINDLELDDIQNQLIGDVEKRGISGGQRKRVNIGMELVTEPTVLALDEPTSGLDATCGLRVVEVLRNAAKKRNLTILTVLHQPRYQIFRMFDHLLLLAPGGNTVFEGATRHCVRYFEKQGFKLPAMMNPADYLLDVVSGVIKPRFDASPNLSLHQRWVEYSTQTKSRLHSPGSPTRRPFPQQSLECLDEERFVHEDRSSGCCLDCCMPTERPPLSIYGDDPTYDNDVGDGVGDGRHLQHIQRNRRATSEPPAHHLTHRSTRGFCSQLGTFLSRELVLHRRMFRTHLLDMFLAFMGAGILGGSHINMDIEHLLSLYTLSAIMLGITTCVSSIRVFGSWRDQYFREASSGVNRFSYFVAANLAHIPALVVSSMIYFVTIYSFTTPRAFYLSRYAISLCGAFAVSGIGYFVSNAFSPRSFQMAGVVLVLSNGMIDGVSPHFKQLIGVPFIGPLVLDISYARWMVQAKIELEMQSYPLVFWREEYGVQQNYGFGGGRNFFLCVGMLLTIGLAYRALAYIALVNFNKGKQS